MTKSLGINKKLYSQFLKFPRVGMGHVHFFKYKDSFLPWFQKCIPKMFLMSIRWDILTERLGIRKKLFLQLLSLVNLTNWHPNIFWTLFLESAAKTVLVVKKLVVTHVILKPLVKNFFLFWKFLSEYSSKKSKWHSLSSSYLAKLKSRDRF